MAATSQVRRRSSSEAWRVLTADAASVLGLQLHPVLARVYAARDLESAEHLDLSLRHLLPFHDLNGIYDAARLLADQIEGGGRILVIGDFDADGATGCAVAVRGLRLLGAADADFLVPNRFEYGYGLTPEIVSVAAQQRPDIIVTVDNGVTSVAGVEHANALGIPVIVTDHHLPGDTLPPAHAIVNPNSGSCAFVSKAVAGVGVMFYVLSAVRAELRQRGFFKGQRAVPNLAQLLDLVALGTVADVVPLDRNNRILVAQGLNRIRAGQCCPGILALLDVAKRDRGNLVAADLGFAIGPRLNAAGRLDDMSLGVACLMSDDYREARALAERLNEFNLKRREIESDMREEAMAHVESLPGLDDGGLPPALCLFEDHWHQGVIGIVAGRIKDRYNRPTIAFAPDGDAGLRGSARSIPGLHVRDALAVVDARHPGLIERFGGHAMAAGLSISRDSLTAFSGAFGEAVTEALAPGALEGCVLSDGALRPQELELGLARAIRDGGPWGATFPEPLFDGHFEVLEQRVVGDKHLKLQLRPLDEGKALDESKASGAEGGAGVPTLLQGIAFNAVETVGTQSLSRVQLVYKLTINAWRGRETAEIQVEDIQMLD